MSPNELAAQGLEGNLGFLNMTLADFTDADLLVRPCANANHTAWMLGHLTVAENHMGNAAKPGSMPELPAGFADKFTKETCAKDDANFFPKKKELLDQLARQRAATVAWTKTLTPADAAKPTPEPMRRFVPTVGALPVMIPVHAAMHIGQMQVIRRKLGKPILF
jgi:hypothetical protein